MLVSILIQTKQKYVLNHQYLPISCFCVTICDSVHRNPDKTDADKTMRKPSKLNCVDWNVNINNPPAMKNTTKINDHR